MTRKILCVKLNKEAEGLDFAPVPGEVGQKVYDTISKEAWSLWQQRQTMYINEYRLNLADKQARDFLLEEMKKFLFEGIDKPPEGYVPPEK